MKSITLKFLAYRQQPKATAVYGPFPQPVYPHSGFLTADESSESRLQRLTEARAQGFALSELDNRYVYQHSIERAFYYHKGGSINARDKRQLHAFAIEQFIIKSTTKPLWHGCTQ